MGQVRQTIAAIGLGTLLSWGLVAPSARGQAPSAAPTPPTLAQLLRFPFVSGLVASQTGDRFAWVEDINGVRNICWALTRNGVPHRLTHNTADDGEELTGLVFSPDGAALLWVRGGDHEANWDAPKGLEPNPASNPVEPKVTIWMARTSGNGGEPRAIATGDSPAISSRGQLAYTSDGQIWSAALPSATDTGNSADSAKPARLFFDRGSDSSPVWSPDGSRLAFVSGREDHSFIGIWTAGAPDAPLLYLAPSTSSDHRPVWSPDSHTLAFVRQPGTGEEPLNFLEQHALPFSIWTADAATGKGRALWTAPATLAGNEPDLGLDEPLFWMSSGELVFLAETDNWPHLYAISSTRPGSTPTLLTPGDFMVEGVSLSPDRRSLVYSANTGTTPADHARRHLFRVTPDGRAPEALTSGDGLEWAPVALAGNHVAMAQAGAQHPPEIALLRTPRDEQAIPTGGADTYPASSLVVPKPVSWTAPDGLRIDGQLFTPATSAPNVRRPAVIFVHGGPPRQMLLGWHYRDYYSNSYAVNQYLALHGFTVLSVNYRLGIGYGHAFQHPPHAGVAGASEYQDVLSGAHFLAGLPGVDPARIGIWGGSYGGYLTGLALARNSDVFKAGVDMHGLYNWLPSLQKGGELPEHWWQVDDAWRQAAATAVASSPIADHKTWRSPVLLIHGDDDRNVPFDQTVTAAHALQQQGTPVEELIVPNEIHGFLRRSDWLAADEALADFFSRKLGPPRP